MILHSVVLGEGPDLVLLHGLFGMSRNFGTIQKALAGRFRVIALDLRNHGDSPHGRPMTYAAMAEDVRETLAAMNALPAYVLGHSMGGKTAMRLALGHPDLVRRLLVADIAPVTYPASQRPEVALMRDLPLTPGMTRAAAHAALEGEVPDQGLRNFLLQNLRFNATPDGRPQWRIGLEEIAAELPSILGWEAPAEAQYEGPTLFLTGGESPYVKEAYRPAIRDLFPAARFVALKRAGHWLHADDPQGFIAVAERFFG